MKQNGRMSAALRLAALDLIAVALSVAIGFRLRFGFLREIPEVYLQNQNRYILTTFLILLGLQMLMGCGSYLPAFSLDDGVRLCLSVLGTSVLLFILDIILKLAIPIEILFIQSLLLLIMLLLLRVSVRLWRSLGGRWQAARHSDAMGRALLYGAGEVGRYLCGRIATHPNERLRVVGFIDDNEALHGARLHGRRVLGGLSALPQAIAATHATQLIIAVEHFPRAALSQVIEICREHNCRVRRFGSLEELAENRLENAVINDICLEDLLRRDAVSLNQELVRGFIAGRCVMVTGGAGSIGSELCRQLLALGAERLVIFDFNENGMYTLDNELRQSYEPERYCLCVGSVRDDKRVLEIMEEFRPTVLFHAAAHKHVPMMELNPKEAVKNNVFGTLRTARAAIQSGVERFVLISTDKAVNPTNIMGASKRIAELCVQMLNKTGKTRFAAVRFGNVLGSVGSVVPHFRQQIKEGGPVTVTHPDMCRYFMTIPEAVQLVLEAGAMAKGGEIFVLDMGEPVKIFDLACDMIRLSGFAPGKDIDIVFTGVRPGEKLFEELSLAEEETDKTASQKIYINKPMPIDEVALRGAIDELDAALEESNTEAVLAAVHMLVPSFLHSGKVQ